MFSFFESTNTCLVNLDMNYEVVNTARMIIEIEALSSTSNLVVAGGFRFRIKLVKQARFVSLV